MVRILERSFLLSLLALCALAGVAFGGDYAISPGTRITTHNWKQYQQFMSAGMQALFSGKYLWKMPDSAAIEVGSTTPIPLPKAYLEDTVANSANVRLKELAGGGTLLENYVASPAKEGSAYDSEK